MISGPGVKSNARLVPQPLPCPRRRRTRTASARFYAWSGRGYFVNYLQFGMRTPWIEEKPLVRALARHEAFWRGELEEGPLMWVTAANAKAGPLIPEPTSEEELWTNVDYVVASTEASLARTHFAGDALPVFCPWLGPDQFAGWLGAELILKPHACTSWAKPFVNDWDDYPEFHIAADNRWWKLYLDILRESVRAGRNKWVTGYPDLHTGVDALSAIRGRDRLALDLVENPAPVHRAMRQMTALWKWVVDTVSGIILPAGQGTTNWTMGWSSQRFLCIGQNDFTCMISPRMFEEFCGADTRECCDYVDWAIYHLDGPGRDPACSVAVAAGEAALHPVDSRRRPEAAVAMARTAAPDSGRRQDPSSSTTAARTAATSI